MAAIGHFKSIDKAIRHSLWEEPEAWEIGDFNRFMKHRDGLELVKPMTHDHWTITKPIGYVKLGWWTNLTINLMVHGGRIFRPIINTQ